VRLTFCVENEAGLHLHETLLFKDQQVHDRGDGWMVSNANVVDNPMLQWWLRRSGPAVANVRKLAFECKEGR
jgi:hypothetical protein